MGLIKKVTTWSYDDLIDYLSVNPTRDEVTHYKVDPQNEEDDSIMKMHSVKDFGNITCLDYSDFEIGLVAVGEKGGYIRLFNVMLGDGPEYDPIDIRTRAKQQRCVNTLGLNNNGLIAMGLDRNRTDASLQIWDINYQSTNSDIVNPTFSYCTNENIVSSKFLNETGIIVSSTKFLKEIDIRAPHPIYQHPTRLSYDIKLNPFNEYQFSSYGDDGTLAIWDKRKIANAAASSDLKTAEPLLVFEKLVGLGAASKKYMNSCFRWSTVRNREFATLHRGDMIKRWWLGSCGSAEEAEDGVEELFVSTVRDINTTYDRVVTFDYIPQSNHRTSIICMRQSGTVYRMPVHQSYTNAAFNNYNSLMLSNCEVPQVDELRITGGEQQSNIENVNKSMRRLSFEDLDLENDYMPDADDNEEEHGSLELTDGEENAHVSENNFSILWKPENLLEKDISVIIKTRAMLGYGLDPMSTVEMIDGSKTLQNNAYIRNTWRWLAIAKAAVDDGTMVSGDLDLGYEGVIGIWNGLSGISNQNRLREGKILTDKHLDKEIEKIIKLRRKHKHALGTKSGLSRFSDSPKLIQRKLCLIISGWDLSSADFEEKYQNIIKTGSYEKAAAWAVFFGDIPRAVDILSSATKEKLNLIATAVAGYMAYKDQPGNNSWRQQCRKMSAELEDPYLRVIFAFIADNDWWDILYEPAISLRERLGVALRFLNDVDLSRFLERTSSTVIENGELEGLILTGITPSGIDLLQSYVNKTSDVQTAALISLFGCPRYFKDKRVDEWVQTYRSMLNSWELFAMRAKFDCLRTKLSESSSGQIRADVKPRQMYIQCMNCKKNISKFDAGPTTKLSNISQPPNSGLSLSKKYGMTNTPSPLERQHRKQSCPHCGTPFPRCVICLLSLGTSNLPFVINGASGEQLGEEEQLDENCDAAKEPTKELESYERKKLRLNEWFSFCLSCNHGMHAGHAEEWFERHNICPAPGCSCQCSK
ncbi:probable SEH-associated protein 4 [Zygosaccharomyces bailii]|nr:probable SEH-associated protein 4 [Zygosaccharomyces bailii]